MNRTDKNEKYKSEKDKNDKVRKTQVGDAKTDETYRVDGEKHAAMDSHAPSKTRDGAGRSEADGSHADRSGGPKTSPANKPQDNRRY
jgi:hypothetical protein